MMQFITHPASPPAGHYSSAVVCNGFVFLSGVLPAPSQTGDFNTEVVHALNTCKDILSQAGCGVTDVVQCTAYIVGVEHWPAFNQAYAAFFDSHKPSRTVVPVTELHHGCQVELQMTAALRAIPAEE